MAKGKREKGVSLNRAPWDFGSQTLASILPDAEHGIISEFREYLGEIDPGVLKNGASNRMALINITHEDVARAEKLRSRLKAHAKTFCAKNGYRPTHEEAIEIDAETGKRSNPNNATRRRKVAWIDVYFRTGALSREQHEIAQAIQKAFEKTQRSAPAIKEIQVDSSPKPDKHVEMMVDRIGEYHKIARHVPTRYWAYISHVVISNKSIRSMAGCGGGRSQARYLDRLKCGLDDVARAVNGGGPRR